ncbi:hypothetical protein GCM10027174_28930 [Salinifilum aidingensis]
MTAKIVLLDRMDCGPARGARAARGVVASGRFRAPPFGARGRTAGAARGVGGQNTGSAGRRRESLSTGVA